MGRWEPEKRQGLHSDIMNSKEPQISSFPGAPRARPVPSCSIGLSNEGAAPNGHAYPCGPDHEQRYKAEK
jgi:hypothetical protein